MADRTLTLRELGRATLARQLLLERHDLSPAAALERVAGVQAQAAGPPFTGLWTRLRDFDEAELRDLIIGRRVVRATMMRHTVHLVTADDYRRLRGPIQPALDRNFKGFTSKRITESEAAEALKIARGALARRPVGFAELTALLAERMPGSDSRALAYAARTRIWLIAQPDDSRWAFKGAVPYVPAEAWLGGAIPSGTDPAELIKRYLAAFGPGTVADIQAWSGLTGLAGAVKALRPELRTFRDERGRELFDVPDGPLPEPGTPAPPRFLPEFDNTILSHADRTRVIADGHRKLSIRNGMVRATFLLDGVVAGNWTMDKRKKLAGLVVQPFRRLTKAERAGLIEEGQPLARFLAPEAADHEVRFADPA